MSPGAHIQRRDQSLLTAAPAFELNRAFTLVELLVVLIVVVILTGVILVEMGGTYEDALLRSSGRKLVNLCNLAASQSISVGLPHRLLIDEVNHKASIRATVPEQGKENEARPVIVEESELDLRISIQVRESESHIAPGDEQPVEEPPEETSHRGEIQFFSDGTAEAREIVLRDRTGVEILLRVNPITGRVRIVEPQSDEQP
ncbi:MAG TPA: prepilin-type N-terminal cleavage/methylation domain-containing protein [Verrucomicrobiae bacterium]|jgi:prepilin-type N-terminal cleavage/methylation domain-containing protein|nr:prepilin-type N-terminal cleavage/methylation domain-containing protein [Verrucomicrobiae bacterium]